MTKPPPIFDWHHFQDLTDSDKALQREMLDVFMHHLQSDVQALEVAFHAGDITEWHGWLHKIYGACASMQAAQLAAVCLDRKTAEADVTVHHQNIIAAYEDLMAELEKVRTL